MTIEEYRQARKDIIHKHKQELLELDSAYAFGNNPYKIGDIVQDHIGKLQIQSIEVFWGYDSILLLSRNRIKQGRDTAEKARPQTCCLSK